MCCYCCNLLTKQAVRCAQFPHHCYNVPLTKKIQKHRNGTGHRASDWNPPQQSWCVLIGLFEPSSLYSIYITQQEAQCNQDYSTDHGKLKIRRHITSWDSNITTIDCSHTLVPGRGSLFLLVNSLNQHSFGCRQHSLQEVDSLVERWRRQRWKNLLDSN